MRSSPVKALIIVGVMVLAGGVVFLTTRGGNTDLQQAVSISSNAPNDSAAPTATPTPNLNTPAPTPDSQTTLATPDIPTLQSPTPTLTPDSQTTATATATPPDPQPTTTASATPPTSPTSQTPTSATPTPSPTSQTPASATPTPSPTPTPTPSPTPSPSPAIIPVTNISGISGYYDIVVPEGSSTEQAYISLSSATVYPDNATNKTIAWSGELISNEGEPTLYFGEGIFTATVKDGLAPGVDYIEEFYIEMLGFGEYSVYSNVFEFKDSELPVHRSVTIIN